MYITYDGIPCECPSCGAACGKSEAQMHVQWANGHGACIRISCDRCGTWTDRTRTDKGGLVDREVSHGVPHPTYQDFVSEGGIPWTPIQPVSLKELDVIEAEAKETRFDLEPEEDKWDYCQQCGAMLDDDSPPYSHDVVRRPYVTASGDLYCDVCGSEIDQEEEDAIDEDYFDEWYPSDYDILEGESTEYYIGEDSGDEE